MAEFSWTQNALIAAQLVAEGDLTQHQIAERADIARSTLYEWRKNPEFTVRVAEIREEFRQAIRSRGIAIIEKRIEAQNDRWRKLQRVISARAEDPAYHEVAGGDTGLLGRVAKWVGTGDNREFVVEFELDAALLREIRELEKQTAQELGQWSSDGQDGPNGRPSAKARYDTWAAKREQARQQSTT